MSIDIKNSLQSLNVQSRISQSAMQQQKTSVQERTENSSASSGVSEDSLVVEQAFSNMNRSEDVDMDRVNQIRASLEAGTFDLNDEDIAVSILRMHDE